MIGNLRRLASAFAAAFALTSLALAYWGVVRSDALLARDDNPRRFDAELAIQRGQILDRRGTALALSMPDENGFPVRAYPHSGVGSLVGYYSLRYGVDGIEAAYDDVLRGEAFLSPLEALTARLLHRDQRGGDVRLTVDLLTQQAAGDALAGRRGALVLVDVPSGEILALVSSPTYDPARLDEQWEALLEDESGPLVNRVTQGLYPPGAALQTVVLGAGLNRGDVRLDQALESGELAAVVNGVTLGCGVMPTHPVETLLDAYRWACPAPFEAVGETLGRSGLEGALADFGVGVPVEVGLGPELVVSPQPPAGETSLSALGLGQGDLTVTPLQMVQVAAAIANHGEASPLRLVDALRPPGGEWEPVSGVGHPRAAISRAVADRMVYAMTQAVRTGAASAASVPGIPVSGHAGLAVAGPDGTLNAWFIGFAPRGDSGWLAIAVLLEDTGDASEAAQVGGQALEAALRAGGQ